MSKSKEKRKESGMIGVIYANPYDTADSLREWHADQLIMRAAVLYKETGDPEHVWAAIIQFERIGRRLPGWIREYLATSAKAVLAAPGGAEAKGKALGFKKPHHAANRHMDMWIAVEQRLKNIEKPTDKQIIEVCATVAEQFGKSEDTVKDAYDRFR